MYTIVFFKALRVNLRDTDQFLPQLQEFDQVLLDITLSPVSYQKENHIFQLKIILIGGSLLFVTMLCDLFVLFE